MLIHRYKIHEEKLFIEKESLKSQLEAVQEEKAKLSKVKIIAGKEREFVTSISLSIYYCRSVRTLPERMPPSLDTGTSDRRSSIMRPSRWRTES